MPTLAELIRANPDATDAEIMALANTPVKTPRQPRVTLTTLASGINGWGLARASEFVADLEAAGTPEAALILRLLNGEGIDPADTEVPGAVAMLVAGQLVTQEEADQVLYDVTPGLGVTEQDVAAARALVEREDEINAVYDAYDGAVGEVGHGILLLAERVRGGELQDAPTVDALVADVRAGILARLEP